MANQGNLQWQMQKMYPAANPTGGTDAVGLIPMKHAIYGTVFIMGVIKNDQSLVVDVGKWAKGAILIDIDTPCFYANTSEASVAASWSTIT